MPRWFTVVDPTGDLTVDFNQTEAGLLVPDANGVYWAIEELEGWDGPNVRQVLVDPYGIDGQILGVNELAERVITFANGFALAPSEDARWAAEAQFGQLFASTLAQGHTGVTVHENPDKFINGFLNSKPEWKELPPGSAAQLPNAWPFQFEVSLLCPFPIKQSTNEASPFQLTRNGTVGIPTLGNYPIWPSIEFIFPCNNDFVSNEAGLEILLTSANRGSNDAMPDQITIDLYNKTCLDGNGNPAWDCVGAIQFFQLKPQAGSFLQYHLGSARSGSHTQEAYAIWSDAWL